MTELRKGEQVEITIRGEIDHEYGGGVQLAVEGAGRAWIPRLAMESPSVTVVRQAPADWPPREGDVWLTRRGEPWFARIGSAGDVHLSSAALARSSPTAERWLAEHAPATLAYRVGQESRPGMPSEEVRARLASAAEKAAGKVYCWPYPAKVVERVNPVEIKVGDTVRMAENNPDWDDQVVSCDYRDDGSLFSLSRGGELTSYSGAKVRRVLRRITVDDVRATDVIRFEPDGEDHWIHSVEPFGDDHTRVKFAMDGTFRNLDPERSAPVWFVRRAGGEYL